jgi:hypothetical protein
MAGVAYRGSFVSERGKVYRIDIYDLTGTPTLADLEHIESCTIAYGTENKDLTTGIIGAELSLNILVKNKTLLAFLKSFVVQDTQRYLIAIYKQQVDLSYNIYWAGNIIQDQCTFSNNSTIEGVMFMIRAMDLGVLQNKYFADVSVGKSLSKLVIDTIRLGEYAELYSAGQAFLTNNMRWRDTKTTHSTATNYLNSLFVNQAAWYLFDAAEQSNTIPTIKAIKDVATVMASRLIQSNGLFWFTQLENYVNSSVTFYNLSPQNATPTTSTIVPFVSVDNSTTNLNILAGAQYEYYRPYSQTFIQKNITNNVISTGNQLSSSRQSAYFGNGALSTGALIIGNFISTGNGNKLRLSGTLKIKAGQVNNASSVLIKFLGLSLYNSTTGQRTNFNGSSNTKNWNSTFGTNYTLTSTVPANWNNEISFSFDTSVLPSAVSQYDTIEFQGISVDIYGTSISSPFGPTTIISAIMDSQTSSLYFLERGVFANEIYYTSTITPAYFDAKKLEISNDLNVIDSEFGSNFGTLYANSIAAGNQTNNWVKTSSNLNARALYDLVTINGLLLHGKILGKIKATIKGNYEAYQLLNYDGIKWVLVSAEQNLSTDEWNGEWLELSFASQTIESAINDNGNTTTETLE